MLGLLNAAMAGSVSTAPKDSNAVIEIAAIPRVATWNTVCEPSQSRGPFWAKVVERHARRIATARDAGAAPGVTVATFDMVWGRGAIGPAVDR